MMAPGQMAQQLRALATLAGDPDLIPSTHMVLSNHLYSRDLQECQGCRGTQMSLQRMPQSSVVLQLKVCTSPFTPIVAV